MKRKNLFALMLALVLVCLTALPVMAAADAQLPDTDMPITDNAVVTDDAGDIDPDAPVVVTNDDDREIPIVLEGEEAEVNYDDIQQEQEEQQQPRKSNNTPYFIGALIAVAVFIGVALYCRVKGNN